MAFVHDINYMKNYINHKQADLPKRRGGLLSKHLVLV